jgi:hypothetical protein
MRVPPKEKSRPKAAVRNVKIPLDLHEQCSYYVSMDSPNPPRLGMQGLEQKMNDQIQITKPIMEALAAIQAAGHGVSIHTQQTGGNSHTNTYLDICLRKEGSVGFVKRLTVKHVSRYQSFSDWQGVSEEFGEMCYAEYSSINALLKKAQELI